MHLSLSFLIISTATLYGQMPNTLIDSWIKVKSEISSGAGQNYVMDEDGGYLKYMFTSGGMMYASFNYNKLGIGVAYSRQGDILIMGRIQKRIELLTDSILILIELDNSQYNASQKRLTFIRENKIQQTMEFGSEDYYMINSDTIYFETPKAYAVYKSDIDFETYLNRKVSNFVFDTDALLYATILIGTDGKFKDITIHHHVNKIYDKNLMGAIQETEGLWVPPKVKGRPVSIIKEIKLEYTKVSVRGTGMGFVMTGNRDQQRNDYAAQFIHSVKSILKGKYEVAIEGLRYAATITPNSANAFNQMSICFNRINDSINRDIYLEKVRKSDLRYLLK